jgi:glycosyltransferase involved in cell wall biosynthesis
VTWLGHVEDVRTVWARAHVAVLTSRSEGLPVALLEAAACGRPIIASDIAGCREIARANENALLVPVDDAKALADAIRRLANDPDRRRQFGTAGRRLVEQNFSSRHVGGEIVKIYEGLGDHTPAF